MLEDESPGRVLLSRDDPVARRPCAHHLHVAAREDQARRHRPRNDRKVTEYGVVQEALHHVAQSLGASRSEPLRFTSASDRSTPGARFNRPIQALFPDEPWWFSPPYTTFTTAPRAARPEARRFGGPWVERRGPRVAATAAAWFFGAGLIIGGPGSRDPAAGDRVPGHGASSAASAAGSGTSRPSARS